MDTYEREIFNYLTKKENFSSAFEIYQQFPKVKNELIRQFWEMVKKLLDEKANDNNWQVKFFNDISEKYSKLGLCLRSDNHENIRVIFEDLLGRTYYGVWINAENNALDKIQIKNFAEGVSAIKQMKSSANEYWLGFEYIEPDFNNIESLERILPDVREDLADELAQMLFGLAKEIKEEIEKMSEMKIGVDSGHKN